MNFAELVNPLPKGEYAEVGVWKGEGAAHIYSWMNKGSELWLFDSFQGHGDPCEFDDAKAHFRGRYSDTSIEEITRKISGARIVPGFVPASLYIAAAVAFRFVRIDLDHYLPTKAACEFFKPRMVPEGIIEFDDYCHPECPGATKAIAEVFGRGRVSKDAPFWWQAH